MNTSHESDLPPAHSDLEVFVEAFSLSLIMLAALIGNFTTMMTLLRVRSLRVNLHNAFVVNLCFMDLVVCFFSMSFSLGDVFHGRYLENNNGFCRFNCFMALFALYGNFSGVTLIAVNRCIGIVFSNRIHLRRKHAVAMIICSWVYSAAIAAPTTYKDFSAVGTYNNHTHHCSPDWKQSNVYNIVCFVLLYGVTVPVMIVCYILIIREIRKRESHVKQYKHTNRAGSLNCGNNRGVVTPTITAKGNKSRKTSRDRFLVKEVGHRAAMDEEGVVLGQITRNEEANETFDSHGDGHSLGDRRVPVTEIGTGQRRLTIGECSANVSHGQVVQETDASVRCIDQTGKSRVKDEEYHRDIEDGTGAEGVKLSDTGDPSISKHGRNSNAKLSTDKRVAMAGGLLVLTTTLCWAPYYIVHVIIEADDLSHPLGVFSMWLGYLNSALDPIIYSLLNQRIRKAIKEQFMSLFSTLLRKKEC